MMSSSNKKIIIAGASSGIGKELSLLYAQAGWRVGITGRRGVLLDEVKSFYPAQIQTAIFDVRGRDNIVHLRLLIEQLGGLDLFIYNAGYGEVSESLDPEIEERTVHTNVHGFVEMVVYAFNYFQQQGHGHIAATSSIASLAGNHFAPAYSASKAFMSNYMEGLYLKVKKLRLPIVITDLQPGFVKTEMAKGPGRFWEAPAGKAAKQIFNAIEKRKFRVYITRRWWLIAQLVKLLPGWLYRAVV